MDVVFIAAYLRYFDVQYLIFTTPDLHILFSHYVFA